MQLQRNRFNFKHLSQGVLITNDAGRYALLTDAEFQTLVGEPGQLPVFTLQRLEEDGFVSAEHRELFATFAAERVRVQKSYLLVGTQLHIFVLTGRCNQRCVYCQASAGRNRALTDMSLDVAERAVDLALEGPARYMTFEFQGGEPTLNFETLKHIVSYAETRRGEKQINYSVVTNLVHLTQPMIDFLVEMGISVSTSLDGPRDLHTRNRPFTGGGSYDDVVANIQRLRWAGAYGIGTLQTTTRHSLARARDIVDEYVSLGLRRLFVRPLTPIGAAARNWTHIGYRPEEFLEFYAEVLGYVIQLALDGVEIREEHASTFLKRIFNRPTNYMELRSPCGATIGQMAYNYDGSVYPCDEARMLAEAGDPFFRLGQSGEVHYTDLIQSPITKALGIASCLESLPGCSDCVYQPYCGVCPVVGYAQHGTIFPQRTGDYRCAIHKGILDLLFGYLTLGDGRTKDLLQSWTD